MTIPTNRYHFTPWRSHTDSIETILPLLRSHYTKPISLEWAHYKFCEEPTESMAAVAWCNGEPVGIAGASTRQFENGNSKAIGAFSHINYVDPNHRGAGLFPKLLLELGEFCRDEGARFIFTFPSSSSKSGFERAGFEQHSQCVTSFRVTSDFNPLHLGSPISRLRIFSPDRVEVPTAESLHRFASLSRRGESGNLSASIGIDFLEHRLSSKRNNHYKIDFVEDLAAITSHGFRGKIREVRILSTTIQDLSKSQRNALYRAIAQRHRPDIITRRVTMNTPPRLSVGNGGISLRSNSLYLKALLPTTIQPFDVSQTRLEGLDIHTW